MKRVLTQIGLGAIGIVINLLTAALLVVLAMVPVWIVELIYWFHDQVAHVAVTLFVLAGCWFAGRRMEKK